MSMVTHSFIPPPLFTWGQDFPKMGIRGRDTKVRMSGMPKMRGKLLEGREWEIYEKENYQRNDLQKNVTLFLK